MRNKVETLHPGRGSAKDNISISEELRQYIIPMNAEQVLQLEQNLVRQGCREPLTVWEKKSGQMLLVDGHHRFEICTRLSIAFRITKVHFDSLEAAKLWMIENQMGRRNLTPDQISYYRGLKYLSTKKVKGGYASVQLKGRVAASTSETLSEKFNVSESTVKRDAKFAEGLNIIGRTNARLKRGILIGVIKVKKSDVQMLANVKDASKLVIRNAADLHNKAKVIREEILQQIETKVKKIDEERINASQQVLTALEPIFLEKNDRIRRIKGMMISAINSAINKRDVNAVGELRGLVEKLANELGE